MDHPWRAQTNHTKTDGKMVYKDSRICSRKTTTKVCNTIINMVAFSSVFLALGTAASVLASPVNFTSPLALLERGVQTSPGTGTHNGFFYSFWTDNQGQVTYNNEVRLSHPSPITLTNPP